MGKIKISFLFFLAHFLVLLLFSTTYAFAQANQDSLHYYYQAILNPKMPTDLPNAISFYNKKKKLDLSNNDTLNAIRDLRMIAIAQNKIGDLFETESSIVEALQLIKTSKHGNTWVQSAIGLYNQLGNTYRTSKNYGEAINAFNQALELVELTRDSITILNNIGNVYKDQHQFKNAELQYKSALKLVGVTSDSIQLAMVLDNLGYIQAKQEDPQALKSLNRALSLRERINYREGLYSSYRNLSEYYMDRNETSMALQYANQAYEVAKSLNSATYLKDALTRTMLLSEHANVRELGRLSDSLDLAKQLEENKNAFRKYNLEEERKRGDALKLQQEQEKRQRQLFQVISLGAILLLIASYFVYRYRYKKGRLEEIYKTESRISKKVHDEVANDVYQVMTKLQNASTAQEEWLDDLDIIYSKTRDISKELSALDVQDDYVELLGDLLLSYNSEQVNVLTRDISEINWDTISNHRKTAIYRVLQELMTNMKKHSKATVTTLSFGNKGNKIIIEYSDNGVGAALKKHNGLQNAENRISSISGSLTFKSQLNKGFKATIIA
ncbi:tetratricopeptide repeat-containing sensor histidine kinase [Muriicola sp. Z0-33]|uniref:tetratricopeptide repeat-containing sensor histidine kinase n=1 Tax=Muriicola sp. Z0-33 TaxID=2816957 RepID=UPI002238C02A|nr:tetratricopeptide repeat-containing sensor histidine kinase [Muriicola sp. Z0-33]MCW5516916.1 tetratricopeptide repeat protein [Muriicola sp. Z0-33]